MRMYLLLVLASLCALPALAQDISGEVLFTETVRLTIELPDDLKDMGIHIPNERTNQKRLLFSPTESLYLNVTGEAAPDQVTEIGSEGSDFQFKMKITEPDNRLHYDLKRGKTLELQDFMGKKFLIKGTPDDFQWKLTGEQKEVAGYVCQQAIHGVDSQQVIAWFSPQLPFSGGPASLSGLPGLILEAEMEEGTRLFVATEVHLRSLEASEIEQPKGGKLVSQEKFEQIVEEKTKELEMEMGGSESGGGGTMIRVIRQ